jgi:hypothetical protein
VNAGGTATRAIELQWGANSERNVIGYRVYGPSGLVCPQNGAGEPSLTILSLALSCVDLKPPAYSATNIKYKVAALFRPPVPGKKEVSTELIGEGATAELNVPSGEPARPSAPASLTAKKEEDGSVKLTWPKVAGAAFYRIYRGSTEYTSRYGTASQAEKPSFVDTEAPSEHKYWVTAVTANLTESEYTVPVTK